MDENSKFPFQGIPMNSQEFICCQTQRLQELELNDRNELVETARNYRLMERDAHRSLLKRQEYEHRQLCKIKQAEILECEEGVLLLLRNGIDEILRRELLLNCRIKCLLHFRRKSTNINYWQLLVKAGNEEMFSELYPVEFLQSTSKLKTTILGKFDCSVLQNDKALLWGWIKQTLCERYEDSKIVELPSLAGWFLTGGQWRFWVKTEDMIIWAGDIINQFITEIFDALSVREVSDDLFEMIGQIRNPAGLSVLLIFRLLALTSRLVTDSPPPMGMTLIGKNSVEFAKALLSTMRCEAGLELINLDSDRIGLIRRNVGKLQDTPVILVSVNPNNKSTQNRLRKIMSWLDSGLMEGRQITMPFVFCLREFSPVYPLDNTVVLATDGMQIPDDFKSFAKLQGFIVQQIENGGTYWAEEFQSKYKKLQMTLPGQERVTVLHISRAVVSTALKMLDLEGERQEKIQGFFDAGLDEIKNQLTAGSNTLLEIFRQGVIKLVDSGILFVRSRQTDIKVQGSSDSKPDTKAVYYDDLHYYFPKSTFQEIGSRCGLDSKSLLFIKQQLVSEGVVRQYRTAGRRHSELETDIFVGKAGRKAKVSVFAIKKEFWDTAGGIALYERSDV